MDLYRSLGGICGAMTSTPALGVLTTKTDSNVPITAYAAVYPLALIMMSRTISASIRNRGPRDSSRLSGSRSSFCGVTAADWR